MIRIYEEDIYYVPNTFTPDGDEFNPTWRVYIEGIDVYDFNLQVFDRWGHQVWQSYDVNGEWDGTFNNEIMIFQKILRMETYLAYNKQQ